MNREEEINLMSHKIEFALNHVRLLKFSGDTGKDNGVKKLLEFMDKKTILNECMLVLNQIINEHKTSLVDIQAQVEEMSSNGKLVTSASAKFGAVCLAMKPENFDKDQAIQINYLLDEMNRLMQN